MMQSNLHKKILVVDDDEGSRELLSVSLGNQNYEVLTAKDAKEAQELLNQNVPDLVLVDIMMPGMNGMELCRWMKAQPKFKEVPIIQISALADIGTIQDAIEVGIMAFVTKPIDFEMLNQKINLAFTRSQRRKEIAAKENKSGSHS